MLIHGQILKWGNSLALRITGPVRAIPKFKEGMKVDIQVSETGITIRPVHRQKRFKLPLTEAEVLKDITPSKAHADELSEILSIELGE